MTVSEFCDGKQLNKHSFTLRTHVDKKSFMENDETKSSKIHKEGLTQELLHTDDYYCNVRYSKG